MIHSPHGLILNYAVELTFRLFSAPPPHHCGIITVRQQPAFKKMSVFKVEPQMLFRITPQIVWCRDPFSMGCQFSSFCNQPNEQQQPDFLTVWGCPHWRTRHNLLNTGNRSLKIKYCPPHSVSYFIDKSFLQHVAFRFTGQTSLQQTGHNMILVLEYLLHNIEYDNSKQHYI